MQCQQDIFIGIFFDGTGNNKYRDTGGFKHSNVARLYEAYAGTAFAESPSLGPGGGSKTADLAPAWPATLPAAERPYYRKLYIPGLGTPFPELGDTSPALGAGFALYGEKRLDWTLLQLANHVHAALLGGRPLTPVLGERALVDRMDGVEQLEEHGRGAYAPSRPRIIQARSQQLAGQLARRLAEKPAIRSVRLAVFGFSRGAALARAFCNRVRQTYGEQIGGIRLEIDFLGIFDTVASVGLPANVVGDGHNAWASKANLVVSVARRCVHLVAAHEVRGGFPLSASGSSGHSKEVVYPGAHSDVGGGYIPGEQGRALGSGADGDSRKLSQIPLAQMYREALIGGVPLIPAGDMRDLHKKHFTIAPETIAAFNAYIQATSQPGGKPDKSMWLTETQTPRPLRDIMHEHWGIYLRWRRLMRGKVHQLPGLRQSASSVYRQEQEIADIRVADAAIDDELKAIRDEADDWLKSDKYQDWAAGVKKAWEDPRQPSEQEKRLFETLVHDSRAGFTPFTAAQRDDAALAAGKPPAHHTAKLRSRQQRLEALKQHGKDPRAGLSTETVQREIAKEETAIAQMKSGKHIEVVTGGHEPAASNGYLRWRGIL